MTTTTAPPAPPPVQVASTTTICDPNTASSLEQDIAKTLMGELSFEIDIDELRLRQPDGHGLDLVADVQPPS